MKKLILTAIAVLSIVVLTSPVAGASGAGGGTIQSPRASATVPIGRVPVTVHVGPALVGTRAGIFVIPGWSLRLQDQPRGSFDYDLFRIRSQTFTIHAPQPSHGGRYTIRVNRDGRDHSAIAQVHVTFRPLEVARLRATPQTFFPLVHDGYKDCTTIRWYQSLPGRAELQVRGRGHIALGHHQVGYGHTKWCGSVGGRRLPAGVYALSIRVVDDLGVGSDTSGVLHAGIKTAHLVRNWKVVESGDDTLGYHTYRHGCRYYINVIEARDAFIDCRAGGRGALFWRFPLRSDYAVGRYHYAFRWGYWYRSETNDLTGRFTDAWARPRFGLVEIGQDRHWLEIVKVVVRFHLETTV